MWVVIILIGKMHAENSATIKNNIHIQYAALRNS